MIKRLKILAHLLESKGLYREASQIKEIIKKAGQIPAGFHRFILETGQFGGSSYDESDWLEEEAKKIEVKRKALKKDKKKD